MQFSAPHVDIRFESYTACRFSFRMSNLSFQMSTGCPLVDTKMRITPGRQDEVAGYGMAGVFR